MLNSDGKQLRRTAAHSVWSVVPDVMTVSCNERRVLDYCGRRILTDFVPALIYKNLCTLDSYTEDRELNIGQLSGKHTLGTQDGV